MSYISHLTNEIEFILRKIFKSDLVNSYVTRFYRNIFGIRLILAALIV
jgi:hypothetical protein